MLYAEHCRLIRATNWKYLFSYIVFKRAETEIPKEKRNKRAAFYLYSLSLHWHITCKPLELIRSANYWYPYFQILVENLNSKFEISIIKKTEN